MIELELVEAPGFQVCVAPSKINVSPLLAFDGSICDALIELINDVVTFVSGMIVYLFNLMYC